MTDIVDKQTRSRMMAGIKGKDTKPELVLRRALHARGFRYRLHSKNVPGRPDIMLSKHQAMVFVHGCFWHRHEGCRYTTIPSTRPEFWRAKFDANVIRDAAIRHQLIEAGWRAATVWECSLRKTDQLAATVELLRTWLLSDSRQLEVGEKDITYSD